MFAYLFEQAGLGDRIRDRLGLDPTRRAFQRALGSACAQFEQQHPAAAADLFDPSFLQREGRPILAQFLLRDGRPDPSDLAAGWADARSAPTAPPLARAATTCAG